MGRAAAPNADQGLPTYREAARPLIGVDIDGVLGDQISAILPMTSRSDDIALLMVRVSP